MNYLNCFLLFLVASISMAQNTFHVFPSDGSDIKGSPYGNGSMDQPWDLETALSQPSERINGGDTIWLHEGIYNGRYKSDLKSTNSKFIVVSALENDKVILNGNVDSKAKQVLEVKSDYVVFRNFEVTFLGDYSRSRKDSNIEIVAGINHISGFCKFQNLKIYNNPGLGFGSWKNTKGSVIEDCMIYYNGVMGKKRGEGEGMYVQNKSDQTRIIRNNIIFGNYYKGIEVWSASSGNKGDFVKNVTLSNNIIFNNGIPSGRYWGNVIIASNDKEGLNIARNIKVNDNVFYHNVDLIGHSQLGNASSLALGFIKKAPVKDIEVFNNVIIGQNNGFSIMHAESLVLKNNVIYTGYVHLKPTTQAFLNSERFKMSGNTYYTKNPQAFRIIKTRDYQFQDWQKTFGVDASSQWKLNKNFDIDPVLKISSLGTISNTKIFNVAILHKEGKGVTVDFSAFNLEEGTSFKIYDVENGGTVIKSGRLSKTMTIKFPMGLKAFEKPLNNTKAIKSADNFGVFRIEFGAYKEDKKKRGFFERLFGWLF